MIEVILILDNIRSAYNVGSILRSSDAAGINEVITCGITPSPDNPKVNKTALGADQTVRWRHAQNTLDTVLELKSKGYTICAAELTDNSIEFQSTVYPEKLVLIVGHEKDGIDVSVLKLCDKIIHIPMRGMKQSLNVSVATGIILFEITKRRTN